MNFGKIPVLTVLVGGWLLANGVNDCGWGMKSAGKAWGADSPVATTKPARKLADIQPETITQILTLVEADDIPKVKDLLAATPVLAMVKEPQSGRTPLHLVRSVAMAKLLLENGAELMALDTLYHAPPIRWAAGEQRVEVVKFLKSKGADQDDFIFAVATGNVAKLKAMLKEDPTIYQIPTDANEVLGGPLTALHIAGRTNQPESAKILIEAGAEVNVRMGWGNAEPLETASWGGAPEVVTVLLEHGADIDALEERGHHTALWYAALTGRKKVVEILVKHKAKIEEGLIEAVEQSKITPYRGINLPPQEDYDEVIKILQKAAEK